MRLLHTPAYYLLFLLYCLVPEASATEEPPLTFWRRDTVTGDWHGMRTSLLDKGVSLEAVYTGEMFSNLFGGLRRKAVYLDNVDLLLTIDTEQAFGWEGGRFFLYGLGNQGGNPSEHIGDIQIASNIEAPDTWKVFEAWFQQNLFGNRLSLLAGLYDVNSEFAVLKTTDLFLNSSFGIGHAFAQSGKNGPSIFPTTSFGLRMAVKPTNALYFRAAVLDGVAGDPDDLYGTQIIFGKNDGLLGVTEIGYLIGLDRPAPPTTEAEHSRKERRRIGRGQALIYNGKLVLGGWFYTTRFDDLTDLDREGRPKQRAGTHGFYALGEYVVYRRQRNPTRNLSLFVQLGIADDQVNRSQAYTGGGLVHTGVLPQREEDQIGFAVAAAHNGSRFKKVQRRAGADVHQAEITLELSYRALLTSWFVVQPDVQYVIHPGIDPGASNAFAAGLRFEVSF